MTSGSAARCWPPLPIGRTDHNEPMAAVVGERALAKARSLVGLGESVHKMAATAAVHLVGVIITDAVAAAIPAIAATAVAAVEPG
jgi:hypothetical protein